MRETGPRETIIATCICVDVEESDETAHYPQIPYLGSGERRAVYWRCVMVFFATSVNVNVGCRHVLYTNEVNLPTIDGIDVQNELLARGIEIFYLPFDRHRPPAEVNRIFRNNFYKLDVIYDACRRFSGRVLLMDSDVVWMRALPDAVLSEVCLYRPFPARSAESRTPNGISNADLESAFTKLSMPAPVRSVEWIGGELIGGPVRGLQVFTEMVVEALDAWRDVYTNDRGRFANGSSVFDNDEIVLSFAASRFDGVVSSGSSFMRRIWTEASGGGEASDLNLCAWHLPNEKLKGIRLLFDDLFLRKLSVGSVDVSESCGVPRRRREYVPLRWRDRARQALVTLAKRVLPREAYNRIRGFFGRDPI